MRRIAALVPNVLASSPGQRVRIESWSRPLKKAGWVVEFYPFEDQRLHAVLYQPGRHLAKAVRMLECYRRQLGRVLSQVRCDVLFVYREAALIGPALLERLAARHGVPLVYDVDDPVFLPYSSPTNHWFSLMKFPHKTHALFRLSDHVITINGSLADYAARFNPSVSVIPNCVDVDHYRPEPAREGGPVRLAWVGSHSTMRNLHAIAEPLRRLQAEARVPLRVIGAGRFELSGVDIESLQWSADTEVADLQGCDIGLVPLLDDPWSPWKFFFKTVQYMAVGLPVVARRMGSNCEVIREGENGFLVETPDEWHDRLHLLVHDNALRRQMGQAARRTVVEHYSTQVQIPKLVSIFDQVYESRIGCGPNVACSDPHR